MRFRPCLFGALLASAHSGQAQTPSTFSLEYTAPAACPDRARFVGAIVERAPQAREVTPASARFRFVARLEGAGDLARGSVSVEQQSGGTSHRDVATAPCSEVVESMAVILSLILAGSDSPPADSEPPPASSEPAPAPPPVGPAVIAPRATPPEVTIPVARAPAPPPATTKPRGRIGERAAAAEAAPAPALAEQRNAPEVAERLRFGVRFAALVETGVAPSVAYGGQGGLDVWWVRNSPWSPSARMTARYVRSGLESNDQGSARFRLAAVRAELCPLRWPARSRSFARACALFDAGQLEALPENAAQGEAQSQTMPWIAGGGSLRLESALTASLSLEAAADLAALGRSDRFTFEPGSHTLHQVPSISAMFSLGAVLRLP